jgi:hypothetical protein
MKPAIKPYMPPPPPGAAPPPPLWQEGVLEEIAAEAGLTPESTFDAHYSLEYADREELLRELMSAGGLGAGARDAGTEDDLRRALTGAFEPYRLPDGGYRLANEWHYLVARA